MANSVTSVYSVKEAAVFPLLKDQEGELPLYGRGVKIPGIQIVSVTENKTITPLPGDDTILATASSIESVEVSIEHGEKSHNLDAIIKGALHRVLANESQSILGGADQGGDFALVFRGTKLNIGNNTDSVMRLWKLSAGTAGGDTANKAFKTNTFDAQAAQIKGQILHPDANDWYCDSIRDAAAAGAINLKNPYPALPASLAKPTISSISVAEGDDDVAVDESFDVTFSAAIGSDYLNQNYFYVVNRSTGEILDCTVTISTNTVTVNPDADLANSTEYSLVIDKNVANAAGVATNDPRVITFTTVAA